MPSVVSIDNAPCQGLVNTTAMQRTKLARNAIPAEFNSSNLNITDVASSKLMSRFYNQMQCQFSDPVLFSMRLAVHLTDAEFLDFVKHFSMRF